jgi:hypothetical protein
MNDDLDGEDTSTLTPVLTEQEWEVVFLRQQIVDLRAEVSRLRQEASDRSWLDSKWGS